MSVQPWFDRDVSDVAGLLADEGTTRVACHQAVKARHTYVNRVTELLETVGLA
jgi:hypothetical protein